MPSWQARLPAALADAVAWILLLDVLLSLLLALGFVPALFITRRAPMPAVAAYYLTVR